MMLNEDILFPLDNQTLNLFASKGKEAELPDPFNPNAAPVRRVIQIVRDLAKKPMSQLSVLDLACGEGVYAVETALRGAQVTGVDGRKERMNTGKEVAERLGLKNLQFEQADVRRVSIATHGQFDVVYVLGILYHLDAPDVFTTLENVRTMSRDFIVIDTHISLNGRDEVAYEGALYAGTKWREHGDHDPEGLRRTRLMASLDNTFSFWFTKESLIKLLINIGFTSVFECHGPLDPTKANNRITLVALKGKRTMLSTYPWINDKTDGEIRTLLQSSDRSIPMTSLIKSMSLRKLLGIPINGLLHTLGYEIRRL